MFECLGFKSEGFHAQFCARYLFINEGTAVFKFSVFEGDYRKAGNLG